MITPELLDFIEAELKAGQSEEGLARLLQGGGGWTEGDVKEALDALAKRRKPVSIAEMRAHATPAPLIQIAPVVHTPPAPAPKPAPLPALSVGEVAPTSKETAHVTPAHEIAIADTWKEVLPPPPPSAGVDSARQFGEILSMPGLPAAPVHTPAPSAPDPATPSAPTVPVVSPASIVPSVPAPRPSASLSSTLTSAPTRIVSPLPSIAPAPESTQSVVDAPHGASLRVKSSSIKKIFMIVGVLVLLALLGGGGYFLFTKLAPKPDKVFATMYASIPGIQSLHYSGETTMNFDGKVTDPLKAGFPAGYTGSAKVALKYDGRANLIKGVDGVHQFGITADLRSGEAALSVNSSIELRIIGDTYYIKITNPPEIKDVDLSRLDTYWIAVSPSDIAQRFGGTLLNEKEGYGTFGGASSTPTVRGFIASNPPFTSVDKVGEEQVAGAQTVHYRFVGDPDHLLGLIRFVVLSLTGSPWEMTADEEINVKALLKGVAGDIWIDSTTFLPRKIVFRQPLQGTVSGIALDGTLDVEQNYSEYNGQVTVSTPRPVITYAEFSDDVKRQSERAKATGDAKRVFDAGDIVSALEVYRANHNDRYPLALDELVGDGLLTALPKDPDGGAYLYAPYIAEGKTTKKSLCTATSATCTYFHLGITLVDPKWKALEEDNDIVSDAISGTDTKGCAKEADKACYDLTPKTK